MTETEEDERKDDTARPPKNCATTIVQKMGAEELRRELEMVLAAIADKGEFMAGTIEKAEVVLEAIRKVKKAGGGGDSRKIRSPPSMVWTKGEEGEKQVVVPEEFVCPISRELMRDPVIVATGQTYDRPFIQAWLDSGNRTCPKTQQVLSFPTLIPNHLVGRMICDWSNAHGIHLPPHDNVDGVTVAQCERSHLDGLLKKITIPSVAEQKPAAKELRLLTKRNPSFRALLGENSSAISQLLSPLASPGLRKHPDLEEDVVTTVFNLSIHDSNKKVVGDHPQAISLLIDAVNSGEMGTRGNAAAALFTLSALGENKSKIGELGGLEPLIKLLEEGSTAARKDAASAIFSLCVAHENKRRAIRGGVVTVLLKCIAEGVLVDECLAILAMVGIWEKALDEICDGGGVGLMLGIIRGNDSGRSRENAAVVLHSVCMYDGTTLREIGEEENDSGCISWLAQNGTSRARRKATGVLQRLDRRKDSFSPGGK